MRAALLCAGAIEHVKYRYRVRCIRDDSARVVDHPSGFGYVVVSEGHDPLLDVMSEDEWREIERRAVNAS